MGRTTSIFKLDPYFDLNQTPVKFRSYIVPSTNKGFIRIIMAMVEIDARQHALVCGLNCGLTNKAKHIVLLLQ